MIELIFLFPYTYWLILISWIVFIWKSKLGSKISLLFGLILFVFSSLFTVLGLQIIAEVIMKFSLIVWIVGLGQALIEYRRNLRSAN